MSMMPRLSSTTFAYQGTPATVDMGYGSFIPSQSIPVTVPAYMKQASFSSRTNSNNPMSPINRDCSFGVAPPSSPSMSSPVTQLPPLSSLVETVNQSNSMVSASTPVSSILPKQVPQTVKVSSPVMNCLVQPPPQQHPTFVQLPQQAPSPMYSGYPTPPASIVPSPQSFIQSNQALQQPQQNPQFVQVYMVPVTTRQPYQVNPYVPLVPSRSLSSPAKQSNSSPINGVSTALNVSPRSHSNPSSVSKTVSKSLPAIINKSNGKRMIQRQLSLDIRRTKQCPVCGKKCSRPSTLKTHYFIHTGDTPYKCTWPNCTKAFNVKSNMIRHMKSHAKKLAKHNIH